MIKIVLCIFTSLVILASCSSPKVFITTKEDLKKSALWSSPNRTFSGQNNENVPVKIFIKTDMMFEGEIARIVDDSDLLKLENLYGNNNVLRVYPVKEKKSNLTIKSDDIEYVLEIDVKIDSSKNWDIDICNISSTYIKDSFNRKGIYVEVSSSYDFFGDEFRGNLVNTEIDTFIYIPKVNADKGYQFIAGLRLPTGSLEMGYNQSTHTAKLPLINTELKKHQVILNYKYNIFEKSRLQPFIKIGGAWVNINYDSKLLNKKKVIFKNGIGYNLDLGVSYFFTPKMSAFSEIKFQRIYFRQVYFLDRSNVLLDWFSGNIYSINAGISYLF
jgi:hypothetical protein